MEASELVVSIKHHASGCFTPIEIRTKTLKISMNNGNHKNRIYTYLLELGLTMLAPFTLFCFEAAVFPEVALDTAISPKPPDADAALLALVKSR